MAQQTLYLSTRPSSTGSGELRPVDDPCHDQPQTPCAPECLEQPRFFCGQLLTDQDLNALLQWSRGKFKLDRYKLGWGAVCGLHLRCDPNVSSGLLLDPGYAVDSCGNDVVVCEPGAFDLADACRLPASHCEDLAGNEEPPACDLFGLTLSPGEVVLLDIFIHYAEEETQPTTALGRGACSERDACEFSRVRETYTLEWRYACGDCGNGTGNGGANHLTAWEANYFSHSRRVVDEYIACFGYGAPQDLAVAKCWLLDWIAREGLYHFCLLPDAIGNLSSATENLATQIARILALMVLDARLAYLALGCPCGDPRQGVPLGRVWLRRRGGANRACEIVYIDSTAPYRRALRSDAWPAPFNHLNLGQFVYQPVDRVCAQLRDQGVDFEPAEMSLPTTLEGLQSQLHEEQKKLFLGLGCNAEEGPLQLYYLGFELPYCGADKTMERRVFTFGWQASEYPGQPVVPAPPSETAPAPERSRGREEEERREPSPSEESFDSLTTINGIGEEREFQLRQNRISTFKQLASADMDMLRKLFPRVKDEQIDEWRKQAKKLQRGD